MRAVLASAATLLLAGCFTSETALYPESAGSCPFDRATAFSVSIIDAGGAQGQLESFTITPSGRLCERTTAMTQAMGAATQGQGPERALFVPLDNGWYVMQREQESASYMYQLAHIEGDRIAFYMPQCADFTTAALREFGVAVVDMAAMMNTAPTPEEPAAAEAPAPRRTKSYLSKQTGVATGEETPPAMCNATERGQIERAFRAWIALGRPPQEFGTRTR